MARLAELGEQLRALPEGIKYALDGLSFVAALAALAQWLPALATLLSIVWTAIRIYETNTVKGLVAWLKMTDLEDGDG